MFFCCCDGVDESTAVAKVHAISATDEGQGDPLLFDPVPEGKKQEEPLARPDGFDGNGGGPATASAPLAEPDFPHERAPQDPDVLSTERLTIKVPKTSTDQNLGWQVDIVDKRVLFFVRLSPGSSPLRSYNSTSPPDKQLRDGDYIVEVNGCSSSANDMMAQTRLTQDVDLVVQRARRFTRKIVKHGAALGVCLTHAKGCPSLFVEEIKEGALKTNAPDVLPGDRIVAVDGKKGDSNQLLTALMQSDSPTIQFSRAG